MIGGREPRGSRLWQVRHRIFLHGEYSSSKFCTWCRTSGGTAAVYFVLQVFISIFTASTEAWFLYWCFIWEGLYCKAERLSYAWQRVISFMWEVQDFGKGSVCCMLAATHPSSPSKRESHITLQRKEACCFPSDAKLIIGIYSSQWIFIILTRSPCQPSGPQHDAHPAAISPLRVTSGEGCDRIRKNQCTCCSVPEMQENVHHFQWAFVQVSHLDVMPTALSQTPTCVHTHSLSCWWTPHHHTSVHCCSKDDLCSLNKIYELAAKFLHPFPEKHQCTTQQC